MDQYSTLATADLPHQIPATSDFYKVRAMGRRAIPEQYNELFVNSFEQATDGATRDYRQLFNQVLVEAESETGHSITDRGYVYSSLVRVWGACRSEARSQEQQAEVYCSILSAAIKSCPITDKNIYK